MKPNRTPAAAENDVLAADLRPCIGFTYGSRREATAVMDDCPGEVIDAYVCAAYGHWHVGLAG